MADVYVLDHVHTNEFGRKDGKSLGTYSARENAAAAIHRVRDKVGFRDHPDGFRIERVPLDTDGWTDGFSTGEPIHEAWRAPTADAGSPWVTPGFGESSPQEQPPVVRDVYELEHAFEDDRGEDHVKLIGLYSTLEKAEVAYARARNKPGFRDHPEGFEINPNRLDRSGWLTGFISAEEALQ